MPPATKQYKVFYDLAQHQFATETIRARLRAIDSDEIPPLHAEFGIGDGEDSQLVATEKLEVIERKLSDDQRYVSFRLRTTDKMTGADMRALMDAKSLPLRVVLHPKALTPADGAQSRVAQAASLGMMPSLPISLSPVINTLNVPLRFDVTDKQLITWKMIPIVMQKKFSEKYSVKNPDLATKAVANISDFFGIDAAFGRKGGQCGV